MSDGYRFSSFVGIDVARRGFQAAFLPVEDGGVPRWQQINSVAYGFSATHLEALRDNILARAPAHATQVVVDPGGGYAAAPLLQVLLNLGCSVVYLSSKAAKELREQLFNSKDKTDHIDAKTLAYAGYLKAHMGASVSMAPARSRVEGTDVLLFQLTRLRRQLVAARTQTTNRLSDLLTAGFPEALESHAKSMFRVAARYPTAAAIRQHRDIEGINLSAPTREALIGLAATSVGVHSEALAESIRVWARFLRVLSDEIAATEKNVAGLVAEHPLGPVLLSFPQVGPGRHFDRRYS